MNKILFPLLLVLIASVFQGTFGLGMNILAAEGKEIHDIQSGPAFRIAIVMVAICVPGYSNRLLSEM